MDRSADVDARTPRRDLLTLAGSFFLLRTASTITAVGLPLFVLWDLGLGVVSGVVLAAELLPSVLLGALIGDLVVRFGARRAAVTGAVVAALAAAVVPLADRLWQLVPLVAVLGLGHSMGGAARMALRAHVVPAGAALSGNGLLITAGRAPLIVGPALAALIAGLGTGWVFATSAVAAALSAVVLLRVSFRSPVTDPSGSPQAASPRAGSEEPPTGPGRLRRMLGSLLVGGLRGLVPLVRADAVLAALTAHAVVWMFAVGVSRILLPVVAVDRFPDLDGLYGYLIAAGAVGGVLGGVLAAPVARRAPGRAYFALSLVDATCWAVALTCGVPAVMLVLLALAGVSESITTAICYAELQTRLGAELNARFFAWLMPVSDLMMMAGYTTGGVIITAGVGSTTAVVVTLLVLPVVLPARVWLDTRRWSREGET